MRQIIFIVNPRAGTERNKQLQATIDTVLQKDACNYEIQYTEYAGHGALLAQLAAKNGADVVVAVGGDGSVNDVLRGLHGSGVALGIVPMGSGNGLARTLQIPMDMAAAIALLNAGLVQHIDIGQVNGQLFGSNAGVGFDALVCKRFNTSERRGLVVYAWLITKYLWLYNDWTWSLKIDGKTYERTAFFISVANGRQFGYNFKIAEDASYTDGLLDVVVVNKFPKILGAFLGLRMLRGTLLSSKYVERFRAKEIEISHPRLKLFQKDGEATACGPVLQFAVWPLAQKVIVPG